MLFPVFQDEAYYFSWANHLDFGYFDHPPLVAFLSKTRDLLSWIQYSGYPGMEFVAARFAGRMGTMAAAFCSMLLIVDIVRMLGLKDTESMKTVLVLSGFSFAGLAFGFLVTPDTSLMVCWTAVLHETIAAVKDERSISIKGFSIGSVRWLSAGVAAGIGMLAKYTMVLLGPVILIAIWRAKRRIFKEPMLYGGFLCAFLVFSPNILWNARHDWVTMKFQAKHGLSLDRNKVGISGDLPSPLLFNKIDDYWRIRSFTQLDPQLDSQKAKRDEREPTALEKSLERIAGFLGAQLAFWGALLVPVGVVISNFLRRKKREDRDSISKMSWIGTSCGELIHDDFVRALLQGGVWVPILFFGLISIFSKVEANWAVMYLISAAILLTPYLKSRRKLLGVCASINVVIFLGILAHVSCGGLINVGSKDRLLKETHGYKGLTQTIAQTIENKINEISAKGPPVIFTENYQLASMIKYYNPSLKAVQWPRVSRPSELTRNAIYQDVPYKEIQEEATFWMVVENPYPPSFEGWAIIDMMQIRDCARMKVEPLTLQEVEKEVVPDCRNPIHKWFLVRYKLLTAT